MAIRIATRPNNTNSTWHDTFDSNIFFDDNTTSMNTSMFGSMNGSMTDEKLAELNQSLMIVTCTLFPLMFTVGFLGNILTLFVMTTNQITSMASRYILILLALCDMTMLSCHLFNKKSLIQLVGFDLRALSTIGCKVFFHIYRTSKSMSSWLVVLLCLERFIAVVYPLKVKLIITRRRVLLAIIGIFLFLLALNAGWSFSVDVTKSKVKAECMQNVQTPTNKIMYRIFLILFNAFFSWIPLSTMSTVTPIIIHTLVKRTREREAMSSAAQGGTETAKISAMLIGIVIAYVICIVPVTLFHINNSFFNFGLQKKTVNFLIVKEVVQYLEMLNYSTNFIIYAFWSAAFRDRVKRLLCSCLTKGQESLNPSSVKATSSQSVLKYDSTD